MITCRISGLKELEAELRKRARAVPKAVAIAGKEIIVEDSAASKDIRGRKQPKYSKQYANFRSRHGLSTTPDFRFTGHALDNQKVEASGDTSSLSPAPEDLKKFEGNQAKRRIYPEQDTDMNRHLKRIAAAGERVMSD